MSHPQDRHPRSGRGATWTGRAGTPEDARGRVLIRAPNAADQAEFVAQMRASEHLHRPWIFPPTTPAAFGDYLRRMATEDHCGFLVCEREGGRLAGVININTIVRGAFLSATLGYYAVASLGGRGYMREGLRLVTEYAFGELQLHRLEANIQPANERSKALVRALGFRLEGLSPEYLYIDGAWRDHERWTLLDDRKGLY